MQNKTYADNDTWTYDNCTSFICSKSEFNEVSVWFVVRLITVL